MTLEEQLREACKKGLTHFTLYPVESVDHKTTYWCARATPSTGHSYVQCQTLDPIEAVAEVLKSLPSAKARKPKFDSVNPPISEMAQRAVTTKVKPEMPQLEEKTGALDWESWK
jgi:hypothetical protein